MEERILWNMDGYLEEVCVKSDNNNYGRDNDNNEYGHDNDDNYDNNENN